MSAAKQVVFHKNVKYAYQESLHSENAASPRSQKVEMKKGMCLKDNQTINETENPMGYRLGTVSGKTIADSRITNGFVFFWETCKRVSFN
jgi:hypothetical protein